MQALARGDLPLSDRLESHLTRCLDCRACEKVCPSSVSYGLAFDAARELIESSRSTRPAGRLITLLHWLVEKPRRVVNLRKFLRVYQRTGLQRLFRVSRLPQFLGLKELEANISSLTPLISLAEIYPAVGNSKGHVAFFTGCLSSITDPQTIISAIRLLNRLGYDAHVPSEQGCCGALHRHHGLAAKATELMRGNLQTFSRTKETILCAASSCTATLKEYARYQTDDESAERFSAIVTDLNQFLADIDWPSEVKFNPLNKRIAVHDPCSLTNILHQEKKPYELLARIPGMEIVPLPDNARCCGAAGTYHLTQASIARQLRAPKIDHLKRLAPDILVTSNPGCATYLAAGLREAGLDIEVMHPVVLLEKQLQIPRPD